MAKWYMLEQCRLYQWENWALVQGLLFLMRRIFSKSQLCQKSLKALGHWLPKSVTGIREQVMKYGVHLIEKNYDLFLKKSNREKFSLTLDEWIEIGIFTSKY